MGLIYYEKLNTFARKYLIKGSNSNPRFFTYEYNNIKQEIAELLLYHEGISFHVYGENIPMAILINLFGVNGVESLIEQGAINFLFCKPEVTYNIDDIPGLVPIQAGGYYTSKAHSDPEESACLGLKWLKNPLHEKQKRRLIKKVISSYKVPSETVSQNSVKFGIESYNNNLFSDFGLPCTKSITELNRTERFLLSSLSNECNTLAILSEFNYYTLDSFRIAKMNDLEVDALKNATNEQESTDKIFVLENLPNFKMMIAKGIIDLKEIPSLRLTRNSVKFRNWIGQTCADVDNVDIVKEYINSIENTKGCLDTGIGKLLKTLGVYAISCGAGELVAGHKGAVVGVGFGSKIVEYAVDLGINLLDAYVLDGILRGWNPRHYFTNDINKIISK